MLRVGNLLLRRNRPREAVIYYQKALKLDPSHRARPRA